jgi:hypothetical protein
MPLADLFAIEELEKKNIALPLTMGQLRPPDEH